MTNAALAMQKQVTYYYTDPQGTALAETDAQGNVTEQYDYSPYGRQVMGNPKPMPGFTGHITDSDTGLVYMKARYYDPDVGRFLSVDVYKASPGDPFSTNLYVYARATPSVLIDPDGRQARGGKDMELCDGPVPCDQRVTFGRVSTYRDSYDKIIGRVFQNYEASGPSSVQPTSDMPEELKMALYYIVGSPQGKASGRRSASIWGRDRTRASPIIVLTYFPFRSWKWAGYVHATSSRVQSQIHEFSDSRSRVEGPDAGRNSHA